MTKKKKKGLKMLKEYKDLEISFPLFLQALFTEAVFMFAVISLFAPYFLPVFYFIVGITLLIMAYNNYLFFKKKYFNEICVFISIIYVLMAIYFITSTIGDIIK